VGPEEKPVAANRVKVHGRLRVHPYNTGMQTLYLDEENVRQLVTVSETIDVLQKTFSDQAAGVAFTNPRNRLRMPGASLHMMAGAIPGYFGYKAYAVASGRAEFFFFLFDAKSAALLAMMRRKPASRDGCRT
jgi:ornithine cyclodeaminase/alanine dehydrogenase-like protein (mu-crystallin family)